MYTKGPWEINQEWPGEIKEPDGAMIAGVCRTGEEQIANARLIAAAPKLLEGCCMALGSGGLNHITDTKVRKYIEDAIAEALEGGSDDFRS